MIKNRVLKKSSIFLLAIILIASTLFVGVHFGFNRGETLSVEAQTIARVPMRGSGTVDDPFLISTVGELHSVRYYGVGDAARGRVFRMENDIDLMSVPNWQPIGTIPTNLVPNQPDNNMVFGVLQFNQTPWNGFAANHQIHQIRHTSFQGHFDGNGFSVRNMAINRPNENFLGLFGAAYYATIRNLGVAHGGGWNEQWQPQGGRGHVIGRDFVGGIVGYMFRSTVSHSWNTVEVGNQMLFDPGGIAGVADHHSHIRNSWNGGPINGEMVGGIVGAIRAGSRIENVYNTGIVTVLTNDTWGVGSQRRLRGGGITGWLRSSAISHAYNHSQIDVRRDIRHTEVAVGGLVGRVDDHGHSAFGAGLFYNRDLVGQHVQWGVYGPTPRENASARSNAQMYQQSTFQGFDFNNVWYMVDGEHTPRLRGVGGQLHDIEFMPNGGTGHMPNQRVVSGRTVALNQNAFARSGYIFAGWSNHPQGAVLHPNQGLFTHVPGQRARLYAQWTTAIRTLQFNGGGGVGAMPSIQIGGGMRIVLPQNTFTRAGHEFVEWFNPLTGNTYADGETFTMPMADTVLYARWTASLQTISFIGNGGNGNPMQTQTIATGATQPLRLNTFVRGGYNFIGWSRTPQHDNFTYADGANFTMPAHNVRLYAQWAQSFLYFEANGGYGVMPRHQVGTNQAINLPLNTFIRTGYVFAGWSLTHDGPIMYANGAPFIMGQPGMRLFAQWMPEAYTITFSNLHDGTHDNAETFTSHDLPRVLSDATRHGYNFDGWWTTPSGSGARVQSIVAIGNITLYARWTLRNYTITFNNLQGGIHGNPSVITRYTIPLTLTAATRTSHNFLGWFNAPVGGNQITHITTIGNVQLWARWTTNYTITFNNLFGTTHTNPTSFNETTETIQLLAPSARAGYNFAGWYDALFGGSRVNQIPQGSSGNITVFARWTIRTYNITFNNLPSGVTHTNPTTFNIYTPTIILQNPSSRSGYNFLGWFDASAGGSRIEQIPLGTTGNLVIYARWQPVTGGGGNNGGGGTPTPPPPGGGGGTPTPPPGGGSSGGGGFINQNHSVWFFRGPGQFVLFWFIVLVLLAIIAFIILAIIFKTRQLRREAKYNEIQNKYKVSQYSYSHTHTNHPHNAHHNNYVPPYDIRHKWKD